MTTARPLVGITYSDTAFRDQEMRLRTYVTRKYFQAVQRAGADVLLLPPSDDGRTLDRYLALVDGLLLPGGEDIDPRYMGEEPSPRLGLVNPLRDTFELEMARRAFAARKPTLGICRGVQVMAVALGGKLHQDVTTLPQAIQHTQQAPRWSTSHRVRVEAGSRLAAWLEGTEVFTNSFHHQAVSVIPAGLRPVATAADGLVEALESADDRVFVGVQWHPEETSQADDPSRRLFANFVRAAGKA
ncbi:MAG: gamma-glutamyl-gamma-aminobutyrate hydrolase family protein [Candidatus Riflebacteria bacterium]|nr:gamma-glutamyl-gamma-aminobutyrate hydrolase family protein [Candidatus Riflebacteria bacterium]